MGLKIRAQGVEIGCVLRVRVKADSSAMRQHRSVTVVSSACVCICVYYMCASVCTQELRGDLTVMGLDRIQTDFLVQGPELPQHESIWRWWMDK